MLVCIDCMPMSLKTINNTMDIFLFSLIDDNVLLSKISQDSNNDFDDYVRLIILTHIDMNESHSLSESEKAFIGQ